MNNQSIPRIIHQTWKDKKLPRKLGQFRETWLQHHPSWEYRLWTDDDNRVFLKKHYAWFLPIYDSYSEKIMQVDAVRYFLLYHFGGVYADLDLECLRPIDLLLEGKQVVIGCEPPHHVDQHNAKKRGGGNRILCNAFMASVPRHPFWEYLMRSLPVCCDETDPLLATGPFFLTRFGELYQNKQDISIESHEVLYPLNKNMIGKYWHKGLLKHAYTIHHWRGSWWSWAYSPKSIIKSLAKRIMKSVLVALGCARPWLRRFHVLARPGKAFRYMLHLGVSLSSRLGPINIGKDIVKPGQMWVSRMSGGHCVARAAVDLSLAQVLVEKAKYPLVSCLMVTRERFALAQRAIECFRKQTYPNKELVIVNDDSCSDLEQWVFSLRDTQIQYIGLADEDKSLGELRGFSLQSARGEYVAQWDDDDISHPDRLMSQMSAILALQVDVAFLHRQILWRPEHRQLGISAYGLLENTMVAKREKVDGYQDLKKGEDTPLCHDLIKNNDVALCDRPDLYVYTFHGKNAWGCEHFERILANGSRQYKGSEYDRVLIDLQKDLDIKISERVPAFATPTMQLASTPSHAVLPPRLEASSALPHILVLTPVKNAVLHFQRFIENMDAATYPKDRLSLAFLESDSNDGTYDEIKKMLPQLRERYVRAELYKQDFGYHTLHPRWAVSEQFVRRSILARSRNLLLFSALRDEEWVLWMDVDLLSWPADMIESLLSVEEDIVVPHCVKPNGDTFDLNTFILSENANQLDWARYVCDGILQPPIAYGRHYLGEFTHQERVEIDGVGGTALLVRSEIHRQGLVFPACAIDFYIETEGLAKMAKGMGYSPCGLPNLTIVHG